MIKKYIIVNLEIVEKTLIDYGTVYHVWLEKEQEFLVVFKHEAFDTYEEAKKVLIKKYYTSIQKLQKQKDSIALEMIEKINKIKELEKDVNKEKC